MDIEDSVLCTDEDDQIIRSTKKVKMLGDSSKISDDVQNVEEQQMVTDQDDISVVHLHIEDETRSISQINKDNIPTSYKNMLLGVNGEIKSSSEEVESWSDEDGEEVEVQENPIGYVDPFCHVIEISSEEREKLCRPWRKAIIMKVLGRRVGYKTLAGRLSKIWNLTGNFELINLQNDFFLVRFYEPKDYDCVFYEGPWMILGHYITIQRWKPEFRPFEESIKRVAAWIRIPNLPIEYYKKHFLWRIGNKVGRTLKVDVHTGQGRLNFHDTSSKPPDPFVLLEDNIHSRKGESHKEVSSKDDDPSGI